MSPTRRSTARPRRSRRRSRFAAPPGIERRAERLGARGHVVFGGRMPVEPANFIERSMVEKCAPEHLDLRDWDVVRDWSANIAAELGILVA